MSAAEPEYSNEDVQELLAMYENLKERYSELEEGAPAAESYTYGVSDSESWENERYFGEYARSDIHLGMLRDKVRCSTYRRAIEEFGKADFKDKVVLDVGAGSGILSCFAARAGAKKVYAVEASEMAKKAELVVARNGFQDVVVVMNERMENVILPETVDVIVSEWMGSFLLFESMLESVLFARDRWLKPDGKMYPRFANIYFAPLSHQEFWDTHLEFLYDVEGVKLGPLVLDATKELTERAIKSAPIGTHLVVSEAKVLRSIDTRTVTFGELNSKHSMGFSFKVHNRGTTPDVEAKALQYPRIIHPEDPMCFDGFAFWFDVVFGDANIVDPTLNETDTSTCSASSASSATTTSTSSNSVILSTKPGIRTHWEQDIILFPERPLVEKGDQINGVIRLAPNSSWRRHWDFEFSLSVKSNTKKNSVEIYKDVVL